MARYLLDSNIISDFVRNPSGRAARRLAQLPADAPCTSIVVAAELRYGAARKSSERLTATIDGILSRLAVLPFDAPADRTYADLRTVLESAGAPLAVHDLFIAAHALTLGCILVTDDGGFERVPNLPVENWLR
jgi:tRNA(fMet)-specific endonuclease VapC